MSKKMNRRDFINKLGGGCAGTVGMLSAITNLGLINSATAATTSHSFFNPQPVINDYKALVCVFLNGGNDSFNMLVPRGDDEYADYATTRTNIAHAQDTLLPINPTTSDGKEYGLHPNLPGIQNLFENGNLAFLANIGNMVEPMTIEEYYSNSKRKPVAPYAHNTQRYFCHTAYPQRRVYDSGWGGRLADKLAYANGNQDLSMSISAGGNSLLQTGRNTLPFTINAANPVESVAAINGSTDFNFYETMKRQTLDDLLSVQYANALDKAYNGSIRNSVDSSLEITAALSNAPSFNTTFGDAELSKELFAVAKFLGVRDLLNFQRQIFFVNLGGFDTHNNTRNRHRRLMIQVNDALSSFYSALEEMGLENQVTTFTLSDFGRKLVSNGAGVDHGWGGNAMVMGGAVKGKEIYGQYPDLYIGNNLDTGSGRFLPTLSHDEYFAELALWFGAAPGDMSYILPNINRFWSPNPSYPIGFMN